MFACVFVCVFLTILSCWKKNERLTSIKQQMKQQTRSFSVSIGVRNYPRTTMSNDRPAHLMLIHMNDLLSDSAQLRPRILLD